MLSIPIRKRTTMYDHHAHVMWQQQDRRLAIAAERRRVNLEAVERARAEAEALRALEEIEAIAASPQAPEEGDRLVGGRPLARGLSDETSASDRRPEAPAGQDLRAPARTSA